MLLALLGPLKTAPARPGHLAALPPVAEPPSPVTNDPLVANQRPAETACFHCGLPCGGVAIEKGGKVFCCHGCETVHDLLSQSGLAQFYDLNEHPGTRVSGAPPRERFGFLDDPTVQEQMLDFTDGRTSRVTLRVPAIHCVACVWLLENLFRLHPGIGKSTVNFTRREVAIWFAPDRIKLSELVALLASIGYEPSLTLGELDKAKPHPARRRLHLQVGVAGFAFGNIMLFSLPLYLGLDSVSAPTFRWLFGWLSLLLALPVLGYSAADYFRSAWLSFRQRVMTLDVPIAAGLVALYGQSAYEILSGTGEGYLDSLAGLVFFLLCGKIFQAKTYDRMAFDADYRAFFPLSVTRITDAGEVSVALSAIRVGDRLRVRNGELIPADAKLVAGEAHIDYSFVTGEAQPVTREAGGRLYAGGRQVGGAIEIETIKPVSQSYLTSLWNHDTFAKDHRDPLNTLTNRYSRRFTIIVVSIALGALGWWWWAGNGGRGIKAFTSVLIIACPCALALAAPFTLGTAHRLLGRFRVFLKNAQVVERLARVTTVVFDKTGTLTLAGAGGVQFVGAGEDLTPAERLAVHSLTSHSTHPYSVRVSEFTDDGKAPETVTDFRETPGCGIEGQVQGKRLLLGSRVWLAERGVTMTGLDLPAGSAAHLAVAGRLRGAFVLAGSLRPGIGALVAELKPSFRLSLLSGDNEKELAQFAGVFGPDAELRFNQTPFDKLTTISRLRKDGETVMMVGDGLNDAGALREADVGVAVVEKIGAFSPASDVIADGGRVRELGRVLRFARRAEWVVKLSFVVSALYNVVGVSIAATGLLSPVICAILMPLSSITVVTIAWGATTLAARRGGLMEG